jgi:hypothetical protein
MEACCGRGCAHRAGGRRPRRDGRGGGLGVLGLPLGAVLRSRLGNEHAHRYLQWGRAERSGLRVDWKGWGEATATGSGRTAIYKPQGGYFAAHPRIPLRASDIGTCPGETELAYRTLEFRLPPWPGGPLGPWLKWSGSLDLCDHSTLDPRYDYPRQPAGICGNIGDDYTPGDILDVTTFELGCRQGREVALEAESRLRPRLPGGCLRHSCTRRLGNFRCRWYALHPDETTIDIVAPYPVQRVACSRKRATISWWFVLAFD